MPKTYDKAKWLEDSKVRVETAKKALEAGLAALQSGDDWKLRLEAMAVLGPARISRLSFRNALLCLLERPDARHVATFGTWRKLGRSVSKGSKAMTILQPRFAATSGPEASLRTEGGARSDQRGAISPNEPGQKLIGFKPLSVFALEQTEGPELPAPRAEKDLQTPEGFAWDNTLTKDVLAQDNPELCELVAKSIGTWQREERTLQTAPGLLFTEVLTGTGSSKLVDAYRLHPNAIKLLPRCGQGFLLGSKQVGDGKKLLPLEGASPVCYPRLPPELVDGCDYPLRRNDQRRARGLRLYERFVARMKERKSG